MGAEKLSDGSLQSWAQQPMQTHHAQVPANSRSEGRTHGSDGWIWPR